jgi:hypothetical protein
MQDTNMSGRRIKQLKKLAIQTKRNPRKVLAAYKLLNKEQKEHLLNKLKQ